MSILMLSLAGFALAVPSGNGAGNDDSQVVTTMTQSQLKAGNYEAAYGNQIKVQEKANNRLGLDVGGSEAETALEINSNVVDGNDVLSTKLSNGKNAEIKIMPNVASARALDSLGLKNCVSEDGCSIELKEVGNGEEARLAYQVKTKKESKLFGLFRTRMNVQSEIDAETGDVIRTRKPWWSFLASEAEEESEEVVVDATVGVEIESTEVEEVEILETSENFLLYSFKSSIDILEFI